MIEITEMIEIGHWKKMARSSRKEIMKQGIVGEKIITAVSEAALAPCIPEMLDDASDALEELLIAAPGGKWRKLPEGYCESEKSERIELPAPKYFSYDPLMHICYIIERSRLASLNPADPAGPANPANILNKDGVAGAHGANNYLNGVGVVNDGPAAENVVETVVENAAGNLAGNAVKKRIKRINSPLKNALLKYFGVTGVNGMNASLAGAAGVIPRGKIGDLNIGNLNIGNLNIWDLNIGNLNSCPVKTLSEIELALAADDHLSARDFIQILAAARVVSGYMRILPVDDVDGIVGKINQAGRVHSASAFLSENGKRFRNELEKMLAFYDNLPGQKTKTKDRTADRTAGRAADRAAERVADRAGDAVEQQGIEQKAPARTTPLGAAHATHHCIAYPSKSPLFTGYSADAVIAASTVLPFLKEYAFRLEHIDDVDGLLKLVFISTAEAYIANHRISPQKNRVRVKNPVIGEPGELGKLREQVNQPGSDLGYFSLAALASIAVSDAPVLGNIGIEALVRMYVDFHSRRAGIVSDVINYLDGIAAQGLSARNEYEFILERVNKKLEEKTGLLFVFKSIVDKEKYELKKNSILNFDDSNKHLINEFYEPGNIVRDINKLIPRETVVRTVLEHGKTEYDNGRKVSLLPVGSIGTVDADRNFVDRKGDHCHLRAHELQVLEPVEELIKPVNDKRDRAIIINGDSYSWTKNGSWGYILGKYKYDKREYAIEFHHLTGGQQKLPVTWSIRKADVKILKARPKKKYLKELEEFEKRTKDLSGLLASLFGEAEEYISVVKKKASDDVQKSIGLLKALGLDDCVVHSFLKEYIEEYRRGFITNFLVAAASEQLRDVSKKSLFDEIESLQDEERYSVLARNALNAIREKTGIVIAPEESDGKDDYENFKRRITERRVNMFRVIKNRHRRLRDDDEVVLLEEYKTVYDDVLPRGSVGNITSYDEDDGEYEIYFESEDTECYVSKKTRMALLAPAFDADKIIPGTEQFFKKGARVMKKQHQQPHPRGQYADRKTGGKAGRRTAEKRVIGTLLEGFDIDDIFFGYEYEVRFDDETIHKYELNELELAEPEKWMTKEKLERYKRIIGEYNAELREFKKKRKGLPKRFTKIFSEVENLPEYKNSESRIIELSEQFIGLMRLAGKSDKEIYDLFSNNDNIEETDYLTDKKLLDIT